MSGKIVTCILFLSTYFCFCSFAKSNIDSLFPRNVFLVECLGHGLSYISLNHEYKFKSVNGRLRFAARYGIGCNPGFTIERTGNRIANVWSVPLVITSYLGRSNNFFVLGVGYTASFGRKWVDSNIYPTYTFNGFESSMIISAGYRRYFPYKTYFGIYPEMVISRHPFRFGIGLYLGDAFLTRENKKKRDK